VGLMDNFKKVWNIFRNQGPEDIPNVYVGGTGFGSRQDRTRLRYSSERSLLASIYTRLAVDVSTVDIRHVQLDSEGRYLEDVKSDLNDCLTVEANIDQAATHFRRDIVLTLCDVGVAAICPVVTTENPYTGSYDIRNLRVGEVVGWGPKSVRVKLYNEDSGRIEEVSVDKRIAAIVENPFYAVMNESSSTLKRLIHKLNLLDSVDDQVSSGKLDLIIQLPYVVKTEARRQQADQRRKDIEAQLKGSQYGIAYTDGTEKITQLNRPAENNLLKQIEYLTNLLYVQLGLTPEVMNGTADEAAMLNYQNRTIKPFVKSIVEAMHRSFLTKTARTQGKAIRFFTNPFELVPITDIAEIADKFTRNEILSANEIRQAIGIKPSRDPKADELRNSNMPQQPDPNAPVEDSAASDPNAAVDDEVNSTMDDLDLELAQMTKEMEDALRG